MKIIFQSSFLFFLLFFHASLHSQILLEDPILSNDSYSSIILSEGFNTGSFPPFGWTQQIISGGYYWNQGGYSANCLGYGSASFQFYYAPSGSITRLITPNYNFTNGAQDTLVFFNAYTTIPGYLDTLNILTSTNSGSTWNIFTSMSSSMITAPATNTFFTPSCSQWAKRTFLLPINTNKIAFEAKNGNGNNLYIDSVLVLSPLPSGINNYGNETPPVFKLYDNYPNPFNPSTRIRFDIPSFIPPLKGVRGMNVKLIIYDLLGREVAVLLNDHLKPGEYEVEFDGTNYPSGIYFYTLIAPNFRQTNKMILVK